MESYPTEIFPRKSYIKKLNVDALLSRHSDLMIVRQVEGKKEDYIKQLGKDKIIDTRVFKNSMANLSFNLAGGLFDVDSNAHLRFLPIGAAAEPWRGEHILQNVSLPCDSYKVIEPCFGLCLCVNAIHKLTFPFLRHFASNNDWDVYFKEACVAANSEQRVRDEKLVEALDEKTHKAVIRPRLEVNHAPNRSNYWHMTLDTYPPNTNQPILPDAKLNNQDRKMFESLKHNLANQCTINAAPSYKLLLRDYTKRYFLFSEILQNKVRVYIKH